MSTFPSLSVWSFNLRTEFANERDGPNCWPERRLGVAELIRGQRPAIVCTQEATGPMLSFLLEELEDVNYSCLGSSRSASPDDERAGILYDRSQVMLQHHDTRWLAPPGAPKYAAGWDADCPRTLEIATFSLPERPATQLRVLNTHFDHFGVEARMQSAELVADVVKTGAAEYPDCVHIICGDFNSAKGSSPFYDCLVNPSVGLQDAARSSADTVSAMPPFTIHMFQGLAFESDRGDGTVELKRSAAPESMVDSCHIDW
eukprot:CAMPEP_0178444268 /NCGR_PEP_ID=MMETSP0689_2-20121128/39391_1 /TAXON_ID=160604 /ORGANISM="Amphidinium massartii, Strain CS-259" /LENGTH=258 /DNA_ID=CAMNT_0020068437 /DNA_START=158 /DNA_END=931 /DNA_ORIENTATION=-